MYLDHFGLSRQPFSQSSATDRDCFYEGGGRGATLDALIYVLTRGEGEEGMIALTGESGSGKTVLCQALMKWLSDSMRVIYSAKKNPSQEALLNSIMDELKFQSEEEGLVLPPSPTDVDELQEILAAVQVGDRQVVLLIDEAHTLPTETLEALWLLYERASSHHKLLQVVLVGEPGLELTLASQQFTQIRKAIRHRYVLQLLDRKAASEYLLYRMSAVAGYEGPDIFSPAALRLIDVAAGGVLRQLNMIADKSLMAAFLAQASSVEAVHVRKMITDLGLKPHPDWRDKRNRPEFVGHLIAGAGTASCAAVVIVLGVAGWQASHPQPAGIGNASASLPLEAGAPSTFSAPAATIHPTTIATTPSNVLANAPSSSSISAATPLPTGGSNKESGGKIPPVSNTPAKTATDKIATDKANKETAAKIGTDKTPSGSGKAAVTGTPAQSGLSAEDQSAGDAANTIAGVDLAEYKLLKQRVEATRGAFSKADRNLYTIVLYTTTNVQPDRIERFLVRARALVDLSNIYVSPLSRNKTGFIVTYGLYPDEYEASMAVAGLPEKYQTAFDPELRTLGELK
ncbi:Type II secretory pathway, component ExeA (predicted ATPase) [Nitrosospira multiformis]|uniref:Type II secretory pathway, component ExeA (Predicted ATPase) n=1 Tax=Nitrosospira multiformis TaxID=1231 RepID=A0A1H8M8V5_9PROT|nr:AAA family ATPase [Nitrosospira multiformis]SEO13648.1 Type II secretory pathway, component ExeA (predicted ATPase) [Nitrosospira multiformis]